MIVDNRYYIHYNYTTCLFIILLFLVVQLISVGKSRQRQVPGGVSRRPKVPSDWLRQGRDLPVGHQPWSANQELPC